MCSGAVSAWLGVRAGSTFYAPDPGGVFGHVGVVAGLLAIVFGATIIWLSLREYTARREHVVAGILIVVLGHLGAVAGALLVGTAGVVLCYVVGIWHLVDAIRSSGPGPLAP